MTSKPSVPRPDVEVTPQQVAIYQQCLQQAANSGRTLLDGLIQQATTSPLLEGIDNIRLNLLRQSISQLNKHRADIVARFPGELLKAFDAAGRSAAPQSVAARDSLRFDQLELMDDTQVQERLEVARAQQSAALESEPTLSPLTALISTVRGYSSVRLDSNPLRPESYISAMQGAFLATGALPAMRLDWLQLVATGLGKGLLQLYGDLGQLMTAAEVRPAAFAVATGVARPGHGSAPRRSSQASTSSVSQTPASVSSLTDDVSADEGARGDGREAQTRLTLKKLKSLLAGELDAEWGAGPRESRRSPPGASGFDPTVPAALEVLEELNQVERAMDRLTHHRVSGVRERVRKADAVEGKQRAGASLPPLPPEAASLTSLERTELHQALRTQASGVGQVLGLEVVSIMVENIANNPRLPKPVQDIVLQLEIPLLRLAMVDPRFFSDKQHPARQLLETITEYSARYDSESNPGFGAFIQPLRQVVRELQPVPIEGPEPFALCLDTLRQIWDERLEAERQQLELAQNTLRAAEQRNSMAVNVAEEIRDRPDATFVPALVLEFATGPWAQVIAQARVHAQKPEATTDGDGTSDPAYWMAVVVDLFWSVNPDWPRLDSNRLVKLIPGLLSRLRAGLKTIQYPQSEVNEFFEILMGFHQRALLGRAGQTSASTARSDPKPVVARDRASKIWLAPAEAQHSGFLSEFDMPELSNQPSGLTAPSRQAAWKKDILEPLPPGSDASHLVMGTWVDVTTERNHMRAQLVWASPEGSMYMFQTTTGRNQSMTRATLNQLIQDEKLMRVPAQNVVDAALDAVAQSALNNSLEAP